MQDKEVKGPQMVALPSTLKCQPAAKMAPRCASAPLFATMSEDMDHPWHRELSVGTVRSPLSDGTHA